MHRLFWFLVFSVLSGPTVADQISGDQQRGLAKLDNGSLMQAQTNPATLVKRTLNAFFSFAVNDVLTRDILEQRHRAEILRRRAHVRSALFRFDLDGDHLVSAAEITQQEPALNPRDRAELVWLRYAFDANKDGNLSQPELMAAVDAEVGQLNIARLPGSQLLQFDLNDDGTLTAEEIISVVDLLRSDAKGEPKGKSNDAKKPKVLTAGQKERARRRAEYDAQFEAKRVALAEAGLPEICGYPAKSEEASLHWLSALRGGAISTIAIDGLHQGTTVVRLHVEKGEQPLYLIAGAQTPVIWQFTGAVDRIERVITRKGNAVSGLDGKQVHFAPSGVCVPGPSDLGQAVAQRTFRSTLEIAFDRQRFDGKTSEWMGSRTFPSHERIIRKDQLDTVDKPIRRNGKVYEMVDGTLHELENDEAARRQVQYQFNRDYPYGVVDIDPEKLVLQGKAQAYSVLPLEAGLLQLLDQGVLRGDAVNVLVITRPVEMLPSGFRTNGADGKGRRFNVDPEVPLNIEAGNLSDYNYENLETGRCVDGVPCEMLPSLE
jgi:hypothetical protein